MYQQILDSFTKKVSDDAAQRVIDARDKIGSNDQRFQVKIKLGDIYHTYDSQFCKFIWFDVCRVLFALKPNYDSFTRDSYPFVVVAASYEDIDSIYSIDGTGIESIIKGGDHFD